MNQRQRKKNRTCEFTEWAFEVEATFKAHVDPDMWIDRFIELAETAGLECGGGCDSLRMSFVVCRHGRATTTQADRDLVDNFLLQDHDVDTFSLGPPFNVWGTG